MMWYKDRQESTAAGITIRKKCSNASVMYTAGALGMRWVWPKMRRVALAGQMREELLKSSSSPDMASKRLMLKLRKERATASNRSRKIKSFKITERGKPLISI